MSRAAVRDRVVELRRVRAGDLAEHPRNWRTHPSRQRAALRAVLKEVGYADALLAVEGPEGLTLIDGHLRRSLDPDQVVPVLVLDLTPAEAETVLATLDPLAELAGADPERLRDLLGRVQASGAAARRLLDEVARRAGLPIVRGLTDPDDAPSIPASPRTKWGDLWALGEHRLLCGDATSMADVARATGGAAAGVLWTDPPYGVRYRGKTKAALRIEGDEPTGLLHLLGAAFAAADASLAGGAALYVAHPSGPGQVFVLAAFGQVGWRLRQTLIWVKDAFVLGHGDYHHRHEAIAYGSTPGPGRFGRGSRGWYGGNAEGSVFEVPRPRASREHPTMKPVALIRRCLRNSAGPGSLVLDPFAGSGSTLIACTELDLPFAGVEIDPAYVDVAVRRWEAFTGQRATRVRGR
jgi:DNA modification methylase